MLQWLLVSEYLIVHMKAFVSTSTKSQFKEVVSNSFLAHCRPKGAFNAVSLSRCTRTQMAFERIENQCCLILLLHKSITFELQDLKIRQTVMVKAYFSASYLSSVDTMRSLLPFKTQKIALF